MRSEWDVRFNNFCSLEALNHSCRMLNFTYSTIQEYFTPFHKLVFINTRNYQIKNYFKFKDRLSIYLKRVFLFAFLSGKFLTRTLKFSLMVIQYWTFLNPQDVRVHFLFIVYIVDLRNFLISFLETDLNQLWFVSFSSEAMEKLELLKTFVSRQNHLEINIQRYLFPVKIFNVSSSVVANFRIHT